MTAEPGIAEVAGLEALAVRCEAATGADREIDCRAWCIQTGGPSFEVCAAVVPNLHEWQAPYYTASLDAAIALVPEGWDHGYQSCGEDGVYGTVWVHGWYDDTVIQAEAATPALALTAAALRARQHLLGEGKR